MQKCNLFFIGTPLNYISAESIVEFFEEDEKNILFSTRPKNDRFFNKDAWDSIHEVYPPKFHSIKQSFLNKLSVYKENLDKVLNCCMDAREINFHISSLNSRDVNFFINGIKKNLKDSQINVRLIPEGLQNVCRYPLTYSEKYRQWVKKTWRIFTPELDFYTFSGDVTGADDKIVDRIYLLPNLPHEYDENKIVYIPSISKSREGEKHEAETALVIGQPLVKVRAMKQEDEVNISEEIYKFLRSNGFKKILYKAHQRDPNHEFNHPEYQLLNIDEPLEEHFLSHHYGMVIGVSSTALLTARMILPKESRIVSYGMNKSLFIDGSHREKIYVPFKRLDIEILHSR